MYCEPATLFSLFGVIVLLFSLGGLANIILNAIGVNINLGLPCVLGLTGSIVLLTPTMRNIISEDERKTKKGKYCHRSMIVIIMIIVTYELSTIVTTLLVMFIDNMQLQLILCILSGFYFAQLIIGYPIILIRIIRCLKYRNNNDDEYYALVA